MSTIQNGFIGDCMRASLWGKAISKAWDLYLLFPHFLDSALKITYLHYFIPYGLGATVSTRVSNVLGAGNPQAAKMAVWAVMVLAITEVIVRSTALFFCRHILGYDHSVLIYSASGVARGSGWKNGGAFVNLVGTPVRRCWLLLYTQGGRAFCLD
ncbi:hypothetical protein D5086_024777 [Populus alba]|uniref:Uncharacterized protein n=1 Tax=Populus alba TaxID=43335 RepID=A0ACC4B813_POPAL